MTTKKNIMDAYLFLRKENHDIPSEALDFILEASMEALVRAQSDTGGEANYCTCGYCQFRYTVDWDSVIDLNKMVCPSCKLEGEQGSDF